MKGECEINPSYFTIRPDFNSLGKDKRTSVRHILIPQLNS